MPDGQFSVPESICSSVVVKICFSIVDASISLSLLQYLLVSGFRMITECLFALIRGQLRAVLAAYADPELCGGEPSPAQGVWRDSCF
jgi:hypothetical protein